MKRKFFLILCCLLAVCTVVHAQKSKQEKLPSDVSVVYFCSEITPENIQRLYNALNVNLAPDMKVGLKVHFGERGNQNFLNPELLHPLVDQVHPTFVETNVLYVSDRRFTKSHIALAQEHGFTFAPIDILDADGETIYPGDDNFQYCKTVRTGDHFENYDYYIIYSHFKGHGSSGFGGAIKNVGMGMASPGGKMAIHANNYPKVNTPDKCFQCNRCANQCPALAINVDDNGPMIDTTKCIGCAKCIAECPLKLFSPDNTGYDETRFLDKLVEYTKVLMDRRPMVFINVMANISSSCDCSSRAPKPFMRDIGAVASRDIVAIDQVCQDLTSKAYGCEHVFQEVNHVSGMEQLQYAEKLGMGHTKYILIDVATGKQITLEEAVKQTEKENKK